MAGSVKSGAYDLVYDLGAYCRRKHKRRIVILDDSLLPTRCAYCGETIKKGDANRADLWPSEHRLAPMHYLCSWEALLADVFQLADMISE